MKRHYTKSDFNVVATTVIALEVMAFLVFLLGMSLAVYNMFLFPPIFTTVGIIYVVVGSTIASFLLLGCAEFLQLLLKIEVNTRKEFLATRAIAHSITAPSVSVEKEKTPMVEAKAATKKKTVVKKSASAKKTVKAKK